MTGGAKNEETDVQGGSVDVPLCLPDAWLWVRCLPPDSQDKHGKGLRPRALPYQFCLMVQN